jgi:hypothetical protein
MRNNDLQNTTHKTKDRVTRTPQNSISSLITCGNVDTNYKWSIKISTFISTLFLKGLLIRKELAASLRTKLQTIYHVGKCGSGMGVSDYCFTPNVQFVSCTMVRTSYI